MKKIITGIFAGALSVVVLAWSFDATGRVGHEGRGHHDAGPDSVEHVQPGPADETTERFDDDFDDARSAGMNRMNLSRRAMDRLELTEDQRDQIKTLRSAYARDMIQLRADTKLARVELRELMNETSPDVSRVKELAAAVSRVQGSAFERGAVFRAEFKNLLTEEQQENLRESFRDRREGRRDSGMRWRRDGRESRNRR